MAGPRMLVAALTDVGRARTTNEDAFTVIDLASGQNLGDLKVDQEIELQDRGVLLALSDGMGGHQAGEVASALVLDSLQAALRDETPGGIKEQLEAAVQRANANVLSAAQTRERRGMGATLTAVFVRGQEAYIAEVGDSRAYLLRKGRLRQITRDQSLVQLMVDHGVLSAAEARNAPGRNVILQAVGLAADVRVAIARLELRRGDRFLLCSDGVSGAVVDDELRTILIDSTPRAACETMIALANDRGGHDNQTTIVADLSGDALDEPDEFETVTSTYSVLQSFDATIDGARAAAGAAAAGAPPAPPPLAGTPRAPDTVRADDPTALPDLHVDEPAAASAKAKSSTDAGETQKLRRSDTSSSSPSDLMPVLYGAGAAVAVILLAFMLLRC